MVAPVSSTNRSRPPFRANSSLLTLTFLSILFLCVTFTSAASISPILQNRIRSRYQRAAPESAKQTFHLLVSMKKQIDPYNYFKISNIEQRTQALVKDKMQLAKLTQKPILEYLSASRIQFSSLWIENVITIEHATEELLAWLQQRDDVNIIKSDHAFKVDLAREETQSETEVRKRFQEHQRNSLSQRHSRNLASNSSSIEWSVEFVKAPQLWDKGITGKGITVGIADTGVALRHPALVKKYRGYAAGDSKFEHNYNWYDAVRRPVSKPGHNCPYASEEPCDDNSHGTHCTGIVLGEVEDDVPHPSEVPRHIGVAYDANWVGCRAMDHGVGRPSLYLGCLQFMLAPTDVNGNNPKIEKRPHIVSNSYGCPPSEMCEPDVMQNAVLSLKAAGVFMAVAAGNDGLHGCSTVDSPPGIYEEVFSVGASNYQERIIAGFSSRGPVSVDGSYRTKPNIVAPGVSILSSVPPDAYRSLSGTSMATPNVAGVVALLWSANPKLNRAIDRTIDVLQSSAHVMQVYDCQSIDSGFNNVYGHGNIDALQAHKLGNSTSVRV